MFPYVEYIVYSLRDKLAADYNDYFNGVNQHANLIYQSIFNKPDMILDNLLPIEEFYVGETPNLIDNYVRNYIMIYPVVSYEMTVSNRPQIDNRYSLSVSIELVVGDEDPETSFRTLLRHTDALKTFLVNNQDFAPKAAISTNIKSFNFFNTIMVGNVYVRGTKFNMVIHYIPGVLEN